MPEHHDHHHGHHGHHGITVHNHHAPETFKRNNRAIFVKEPHITHHGHSSVISFFVTEQSLENTGLTFLNPNNPNYRHHTVKRASVVAQQNSQPDYWHFAGTVQYLIDTANLASIQAGSLTTTVTITLSTYDQITGFTNVPKLLYLELEYHHDTVHH